MNRFSNCLKFSTHCSAIYRVTLYSNGGHDLRCLYGIREVGLWILCRSSRLSRNVADIHANCGAFFYMLGQGRPVISFQLSLEQWNTFSCLRVLFFDGRQFPHILIEVCKMSNSFNLFLFWNALCIPYTRAPKTTVLWSLNRFSKFLCDTSSLQTARAASTTSGSISGPIVQISNRAEIGKLQGCMWVFNAGWTFLISWEGCQKFANLRWDYNLD